MWIWQRPDWPNFRYSPDRFAASIKSFHRHAERLAGRMEALPDAAQQEALVDLMVSEAIKTSQIEGEQLDRDSVRSSIKAFAGLAPAGSASKDPRSSGVAALMVDARQHWRDPLSEPLLCRWQSQVVVESPLRNITRGHYRTEASPMQVVSGPIGREQIHFEAPPSNRVPLEMARFLDWYNDPEAMGGDAALPGPLRAGVAHLWFEIIHPFDDGNGRVGRAIADHALSQALGYPTIATLSTAIERDRKGYYEALGRVGRDGLDITGWLNFFVDKVAQAQEGAKRELDFVIGKTRYFDRYRGHLNPRQDKAVSRMFAAGPAGFEGGMTARKYVALTKCSRATATRDLGELVDLGALVPLPGGGRSAAYALPPVGPAPVRAWAGTAEGPG